MSAFLIEKKTIVASECRRSEFSRRELAEKLKVDVLESGWRDKLGQRMWSLNQLALCYRYADEMKEDLKHFFEDVSGHTSYIQMFKSLKCWRYQCAEEEIPDGSVLYRVFSHEISLYLALRLIQETPEYEKAEWG